MSFHGLLCRASLSARCLRTKSKITLDCLSSRSSGIALNAQQPPSRLRSSGIGVTVLDVSAPGIRQARLSPFCQGRKSFLSTTACQLRKETKSTHNTTIPEPHANKDLEREQDVSPERIQKPADQPSREPETPLSDKLLEEVKEDSTDHAAAWRLLRVARPEFNWLFVAFTLLAASSLISMIIPYAIGKVMDVGSAAIEGREMDILGFTVYQFLFGLAGIFTVGAGASFGSIVLLRVLGERVVARLRSQLYRRIYVQNAEFFDANRVGDLMSRLTLDTSIVAKSVTQNLSHGLSNLCISVAGVSIMVWTSPKLTGLLLLMFPPAAVGTVIYGNAIRNVSKAMQKMMGSLTKTVEERLGNVKDHSNICWRDPGSSAVQQKDPWCICSWEKRVFDSGHFPQFDRMGWRYGHYCYTALWLDSY